MVCNAKNIFIFVKIWSICEQFVTTGKDWKKVNFKLLNTPDECMTNK